MTFKRCRSCNSLYYWYYTEQNSRNNILCSKCCDECEEACYKIREYFNNNPKAPPFEITDADTIAEITGTSPVLVWILKKEGRLGDTTKHYCIHCNNELQENEKKVCQNCAMIISQKLTMALNDVADRWNSHSEKRSVKTEKRRYGLGHHE